MWLRTLARSCHAAGVVTLMDLDAGDATWTPQPASVNRILKGLQKDVGAIHRTRLDTRDLGYVDTNYWGFRFPDRRSAFDLTGISQRWLRDITWDHLADVLDGPARPRTAGPIEQVRRSLVCLSAYLRECDPFGGGRPDALTGSTGKGFVADITSRVTGRQPVRGVVNRDGSTSPATPTSYALTMNAVAGCCGGPWSRVPPGRRACRGSSSSRSRSAVRRRRRTLGRSATRCWPR